MSFSDQAFVGNVVKEPRTVAYLKTLVASANKDSARKKDPGRKKKSSPKAKKSRRGERRLVSVGPETPPLLEDLDPWIDELPEWQAAQVRQEQENERLLAELSEEDLEDPKEQGDKAEVPESDHDFEDNLTYHEDSLSVMRGTISTPLGEDVPIWITTDTGSMTQLIQADVVKRLKLETKPLSNGQSFSIKGPGGGHDVVDRYVALEVKIKMKLQAEAGLGNQPLYEDNPEEEQVQKITLTFGVCESLPVPILWGGKQMRRHGLVDYYNRRLLAMRLDKSGEGDRYVTESTSWLVAAAQMKELTDPRLKRAYKAYIPSTERLANMVKGERKTINLPALLYPRRDNLVRVARHNARVDEGSNEIVVLNREAFEARYGSWLVTMDTVVNGEAHVVVANNSDQVISLPAGVLDIAVRPAVCLPRVTRLSELEEEKGTGDINLALSTVSEHESLTEAETLDRSPTTFLTWNCNGLAARMKRGELERQFYDEVMMSSPDIISLQEVRLRSNGNNYEQVDPKSSDAVHWENFMAPLRGEYNAYLTLSAERYGGQAVLVKKSLNKPSVSYCMGGETGHHKDGRFMKLTFPDMVVRSVYAPFNGKGQKEHLQRRREWDQALFKEMTGAVEPKQGRILMGDLNVAYRDSDLSPHEDFWLGQGPQDGPIGDRGFGGTTRNERDRFKEMMECSELSDTFTVPSGRRLEARWTFRGKGAFFGKGMKVDYVLADDTIMLSGGVKHSRILCNGRDREGFMGSDHAPMLVELHSRWRTKRANLLAHYASAKRHSEAGVHQMAITREERQQLAVMFSQVAERGGAAKAAVIKGNPAGSNEPRPVEFPEELWKYVNPAVRADVGPMFSQFKSREYLEECIGKVIKDLDIEKRDEYYHPEWKPENDQEDWLQESVLRAQAIANLDCYFFPNPEEVAMAKDVLAEIETIDDKPFKCRSRKLSVVQQAFLQAKTNIMLEMKQLEEAKSDWCHGLVLVAYEDRINSFMVKHGDEAMGKLFLDEHREEVATFFRLCVDLRMLNAKTIPDRFPLPRIDDLLESIPRGCGRFSISDIADAFFKCELKKEDRHKTAFKTHNRHLQFAVLPQGFINSPSVFCRLIAKTFEGVDRRKFSAYIDDVLNHTEDFGEHLDIQQDTYARLRGSQLTLKLSKTHLNYSVVKFLGHILTREGRLPDPKAVEAIDEWRDPTTAKEVRSFLGATLYYREYIYNYADMAMPLYDLIRKGVIVEKMWDKEVHSKAVQQIKDALTSKPVLMQVDNTRKFRLKVDACRVGRGIGGILEQQNAEGKWQPVSYYSSSLSKEERNYSATELECKALHDCILHWAVYLKHIPHFEVFSDHNALRYMVASDHATTNGRLMRYLLNLQGYNFAIYYRKGTENCDADAVSRLLRTSDQPIYLTEEDLGTENGVVSRCQLQRARALDRRNRKTEKEARRLLRQINREELNEMSLLHDHILAEGVENLESETGRARFYANLRKKGMHCTREQLDETLEQIQEDQGPGTGEDGPMDPALVNFSKILVETGGVAGAVAEEHRAMRVNQVNTVERSVKHYSEVFDRAESGAVLPGLLINLVDSVAADQRERKNRLKDMDESGRTVRQNMEAIRSEPFKRRQKILERVTAYAKLTRPDLARVLTVTRSSKSRTKKVKADAAKVVEEDEEEEYEEADAPAEPSSHSGDSGKTTRGYQSAGQKQRMQRKVRKVQSLYGKRMSTGDRRELRQRIREVHYNLDAKTQPNWKHSDKESRRSPINEVLEKCRRKGRGLVEVRDSLMEGDSGLGLFAVKSAKKGDELCTYEGVEVDGETLTQGYNNGDYVASAIKDPFTKQWIYIDGQEETCGYGRFSQDPIDEHLVNAKILWRDNKMKLIATCEIKPGDEILVHYGLDYWKTRLHLLAPEVRARIEEKCRRKHVQFAEDVTVAVYKDTVSLRHPDGLVTSPQVEVLQSTPDNFLTRAANYVPEEEEPREEHRGDELDQAVFEELAFENVEEGPELAEELVHILNGRKFEDEGRLYEIMQVQWDPGSGHIVGWRRPLSGKHVAEDGVPFLVYGLEGLYELSERYLLTHPEDKEDWVWPKNGAEWSMFQRRDPDIQNLIDEIEDTGGMAIRKGKEKYALVEIDPPGQPILVREVQDARKGLIQQAVVPPELRSLTLKYHHEGFGHMGASRMLETIRLRYFWSGMDKDIQAHTGKCINCKLRKSYQRKPRVPIMKYTDTARPLDRVHVDLTGPLPETQVGHKYIMVIKDYLTKYVWLIPLKTKGAVEVAEAFVGEFVCQAGVPGRVVSDRGNEFVNRLLANVSRILGINRISTTPYNPRSDGFVENHNRILKDQLFHFVDTLKQDDWDVYLPTVQLMYNTTVSLATGYTPMLLLTGRECKMPTFNHMDSVDLERDKSILSNEYVRKMVETMRSYQDMALKQTLRNKERLNVRVRQPLEFVEYEPGDQFMKTKRPVSTFKSAEEEEAWKISMKLLERYEGPYRIIRKISPILYDAEIDGKEVRVHAGNMKPY